MKRIVYSCLLIALLSCGSSRQDDYHIKVAIRDSTINDFYLLSVRKFTLVVSPYYGNIITDDSLVAHAQVIPFDKIEAIYYRAKESTGILPGLGGSLFGTAVGCVAGGYSMKQEGDLLTLFAGGTIGAFLGFGAGMLIANALQQPKEKFLVDFWRHTDQLRTQAIFPEIEPSELQKIK